MDLRDISYFEAVARTETYDEAALLVGRTKQALTKSVQRLEEDVGGKLFEREGRGKRLTPLGQVLLEKADSLRLSIEDIEREVSDFAKGASGLLRIGTGTTPLEQVLPKACSALQKQSPDVRIELVIGMNDVLQEHLRKGEVDIILSPTEPEDSVEFSVQPILNDEVVVAAGSNHPLVGRKVSLEDMAACEWALPSRSMSTRNWLDQAFASRGLPQPHARVDASSITALPKLVEEMQLLTFLGRSSLHNLCEIPHPDTTLERKFAVMRRRNSYVPPAAEKLIDILRHASRQ